MVTRLYYRQADAIDLLVDVEGIDVGHSTDIVEDSHDALLQVGVVDVVLAAYTADELLGIETGRVDGGINKHLHQRSHNFIT